MKVSDVAAIAAALSDAQRRYLEDAYYGQQGWRIVGFRAPMAAKGLCHPGTSRITPLGLAVRNHLTKAEPGGTDRDGDV